MIDIKYRYSYHFNNWLAHIGSYNLYNQNDMIKLSLLWNLYLIDERFHNLIFYKDEY